MLNPSIRVVFTFDKLNTALSLTKSQLYPNLAILYFVNFAVFVVLTSLKDTMH